MNRSTPRILTGDRPTGRLHLGHYVGSLANRVRLQGEYECFFIIADLHTLTTHHQRGHLEILKSHVHHMVLDYLAAGIDPERCVIFRQSDVPETAELSLLLGMLITVPRLERLPTLKDMARAAALDRMPFGLLGYPVLQAADILLPRANLVPVGRDNESHVEITRELARHFNHLYGQVFPVPQALIGDVPALVGTDGEAKMSKSLDNTIYLADDPATVRAKIRRMKTDPQRVRADIPGRVAGNPVFVYHQAFNPDAAAVDDLAARYRQGRVGDVEVKDRLAEAINAFLEPMHQRRAAFAARDGLVSDILAAGAARMRQEAHATMSLVRTAMGL